MKLHLFWLLIYLLGICMGCYYITTDHRWILLYDGFVFIGSVAGFALEWKDIIEEGNEND